MRIFFREFFGHVEPASSARCKLHFGCIWTQKPPRDMAKMIPFSFSFFLPFIFRATSDTHNFQFFHPLFRAPPRHPNMLLDGLGLSPASLSLSFLIIFHCRPAWASKNVQFSRGSSTCRLFLSTAQLFEGFLLMPSLTGLQVFVV